MLVVDDSIVRGNTTMMLVDAIRRAGANHVFVASAAPPIRFCNVYGIDMPTRRELIAFQKTEKEVAAAILWLCQEDAAFVTGQVLGVGGGFGA